jgi:hypothetical protein
MDDPSRLIPNTEKELPNRQSDRNDMALPITTKSRTEKELPNRTTPNVLQLDPSRQKVRRESEDPK